MTAPAAHCPPCRVRHRARSETDRRRGRHALGALAVMLWVVAQMILACHDRHPPMPSMLRGAEDMHAAAALIASSLCRTSAGGPSTEDGRGTAATGCLHCAGGGCHGAARTTISLTWAPFVALNLPAGHRSNVGNNGAARWQTGHPVRGPPSWAL